MADEFSTRNADENLETVQGDSQENDPDRTMKSLPVPDAPTSIGLNGSRHTAATWTHNEPVRLPASEAVATTYFPKPIVPPPPSPLVRESAVRERVRRRHVRGGRPGSEWAWVIIAMALLSVALIIGMSILLILRVSSAEPEVLPTAAFDLSMLPTAVSFRSDLNQVATGRTITLDNGYSMILEPWNGTSRYTILIMGLDRRPDEKGLAYRTDTMMLVSLDPASKRIGILSIPRDLYVAFPGYYERQRVNSAMVIGEVNGVGGPQFAMQTIQYNMGIRVHDYLIVDFKAVIDIVDAIGGIEITTDYNIYDPAYPDMNFGYDPFYLQAGTHLLDGRNALKFARTRHGDSDIERAKRQQQVIYAIRDRVLSLNMLPQLILQAPVLLNSYSENVYTSVDLPRMIELAWYAKDIPEENIISGVMDYRYLSNWTTSDNAQVLIPNNRTLPQLMIEVFGANYSESQ